MSKTKASDPTKRRPTRYRGITYRVRKDGTHTYSIYHAGRYVLAGGSEQEALVKQGELRRRAAQGERAVVPSRLTFTEVAEMWFESKRHLRAWTRKNYRASLDNVLIPRFGSKRIAEVTVEHVAVLIRDLERKGQKPSTIDNHLKPLSGTFGFALRRGFITENPCRILTRDDRPTPQERKHHHVWSDEEMAALVAAAEYRDRLPQSRYGEYAPLIRLALATGLRLGELLGLQWRDLDLQSGELHVRRQWARTNEYAKPKTRAGERRIPLSRDIVSYLRDLRMRSTHSQDEHPIFASRSGQPLSHRNATRRGFEPAAKKAGIDGITFHDMRHAFASRMISRGIDPVALAKLLGHQDARVTLARYTHEFDRLRTDDLVREAMAW